jgi:peptide/nickel transport system permease protein
MTMRRYVFSRLVLMVPTLLCIVLVTFIVAHLAPGDPFELAHEGSALTEEGLAVQRQRAGLNAPLAVQFGRWARRVAALDFGRSLVDRRPVLEKMGEALPRTAMVAALALVVGVGVAVPLGVVLAVERRRRWARLADALLLVGFSIPSFWLAVVLLLIFAGPRFLGWFPVQGLADGGFVLPVLCLTWPTCLTVARQVRGAMAQALAQDFITSARARGIPPRRIVWRHALGQCWLPVLTLVGLHVPHLLGGSVAVERVFGISGMGRLAFEAIGARDYPVVMGVTTVVAGVTLMAMLAVDLLYAVVDPRISFGRRA